MPGKVLQSQKGKPGHILRAQNRLNLFPVAQPRQFPRSLHIPFPDRGKPLFFHTLLYMAQIGRVSYPMEILQFVKIGKHLILSYFKPEHRPLIAFP